MGVQHYLVDLATLGAVARADGEEIYLRGRSERLVSIQDRHQWGLALGIVRLDGGDQTLDHTVDVGLVA